jgi:signal transduction histidine kinase
MQEFEHAAYKQSILYRYGLGFLVTCSFLLFAKTLYLLISYNPLVIVITAIIVVSWLFGRGPGVASAVIAAFGARPLFFPNVPYRFDGGDLGRLALYLLLTGLISYLVGARRKAEAGLLAANAALDRRVQERTAELEAVNEDLRRSNEALRRANIDLEQFAYSASHDLQEPLRNMAIYAQLLNRRYAHVLDERGREFLKIVSDGAQRMGLLITDLLVYTQTGRSGTGTAEMIDANAVLEKVLVDLSSAVREAGANIVNQGLPRLQMEEVHLQQLFQNIIGNALKYRSEQAPLIHISSEQIDGYWRFSLKDNGIGINPDYKETIFGIFKRLHSNGDYAGTGIGLAICQRLVERYDGRIWVESEAGKGATFFFTVKGDGAQGSPWQARRLGN